MIQDTIAILKKDLEERGDIQIANTEHVADLLVWAMNTLEDQEKDKAPPPVLDTQDAPRSSTKRG